jgi:hypothetical protein
MEETKLVGREYLGYNRFLHDSCQMYSTDVQSRILEE